MKYTLLIFTLFTALLLRAQNDTYSCGFDNEMISLGIGVITTEEHFIVMYNDSLMKDKYVSWDYRKEGPEKPVCGVFFKPDYGILHVVCLRKLKKGYEVLINYNEKKYMPYFKSFEFHSWERYLDTAPLRVGRKEKDNNRFVFYTGPSEKSDPVTINYASHHFCVQRTSGDWVEVQLECDLDESTEGLPCADFIHRCDYKSGWFQWRKGNKLNIEIYLLL
ncbi:MAG: hypothetical protein M0D57_03805 [Sphingobacteriales bacterium JAD_PAG50586_3]|nr:MAG: hypothetical protein M0D57_03805 [Sphingobacteriales bacterium JAD_PAG50586_3]